MSRGHTAAASEEEISMHLAMYETLEEDNLSCQSRLHGLAPGQGIPLQQPGFGWNLP